MNISSLFPLQLQYIMCCFRSCEVKVVIVEKSQILHYLLHSNLILSVIYGTHRQIYSIAVHKEIVLFKGT